MKIILYSILIIFSSQKAFAYVDPGMGSAFIQLIVAIVSAIAFYISYTFGLIKKFFNKFTNLFKNKKKKSDT